MDKNHMLEQLWAFPDKEFGHGASMAEIAGAEQKLQSVFPTSYRQFLHDFGWARFSHEELYGLGPDTPAHLELIKNAIVERERMSPRLPEKFIPIMNDGGGNHYCLDTGKFRNFECPVVFWNHELSVQQECEQVAVTFDEWLIGLVGRLSGA